MRRKGNGDSMTDKNGRGRPTKTLEEIERAKGDYDLTEKFNIGEVKQKFINYFKMPVQTALDDDGVLVMLSDGRKYQLSLEQTKMSVKDIVNGN